MTAPAPLPPGPTAPQIPRFYLGRSAMPRQVTPSQRTQRNDGRKRRERRHNAFTGPALHHLLAGQTYQCMPAHVTTANSITHKLPIQKRARVCVWERADSLGTGKCSMETARDPWGSSCPCLPMFEAVRSAVSRSLSTVQVHRQPWHHQSQRTPFHRAVDSNGSSCFVRGAVWL
jgi:hypothetical protein